MAAVLLYVCSVCVVWVCSSVFIPTVQAGCESLGNNVDCSKSGLLNIPPHLPEWVRRLELQSNGITEIRMDDLKGLTHLVYLDLSKNDLSVIDGSVFRDLVKLKFLILDSNQLTEIPLFPKALDITTLSMVKNHIVTIPMETIKRMPQLERLDLSNNNLLSIANGSFPKKCKLQYLNLNGNKISAIDQGSLNNLTALEILKLNRNKLTDLPQAAFSQLSRLKTLELMRNSLRIITGLTFQGLQELQNLKMKKNQISMLKDGAFYGLTTITHLYLDHNKIGNITKAWLFGLKSLKHLSLSHNHISKIEREAWESCPHLDKLYVDRNRITAITDKSLAHLSSLRFLSMDHNLVSRIDEGAFQDLGKLSVLQLSDNEISWTMEDVSGAFRGLHSLTRLGLRSNGIRSVAVPAFSGLLRLRQLDMEDNDFMSIQENAFGMLRGLRDLRFNSSKLFCDCNLAWLPSWLIQQSFQHSAIGTCFHPLPLRGVSIYQLDVKKLTCNDSQLPKPVILESPKSANGFKGENLTLSCTIAITGKGQPNIHWKKDRMLLSDTNTEVVAQSDGEVKRFTSYLHLVNIKDSMAGRYQCLVSNDFGSTFSQRAYVNVYVYPVFIKTPKDVTVKAGKPAELKCAATGQPAPVISWQKDGGDNFPAARERRMQVYPNDDRFYILNTRSADEGIYSCMATNEAGQVMANATVAVLETPDFVEPMQSKKRTRQGETSVLQCMASGRPPPKLTWLKDNKELQVTPRHFFTVDNQLLVIVDTQRSDAGVYACRMSNSLGTAKGSTELQVLSASGDSGHSSGGSSGLDDESTTTGIIIIAVVCCVVGTSLVWVIIIYQTRKRHEVYSSTPTDETTLPGEIQSSGYMSSDKEGSYSQGVMATSGYYYQDYQMKESGYESSSGQYRPNDHLRPMAAFANDDEDDQNPPVVTAGDKLLQQIRNQECSASSLHYPASDGDTIGSRHSTSSGQQSGSSNPPSSHSGHSSNNHQLHIVTNPMALANEIFPRHPSSHPSTPSPMSDEIGIHSGIHGSKNPLTMDLRPVLQTFHPTKPTNHDKLSKNGPLGQWEGRDEYGCDPNVLVERYPRQRHFSDSCDKRDAGCSPALVSSVPCPGCLAAQKTSAQDVHWYSQIDGRGSNNNRWKPLRDGGYPDAYSSSNNNGRHRNVDSKFSFSSLPSSSHSSSSCQRHHMGSHSRGHGQTSSSQAMDLKSKPVSAASSSVYSECKKSIEQAATNFSPLIHTSNHTDMCLCHGARDHPPPNYNEVILQHRYYCVPQASSPSKALSRSKSSSSVGRDPMYYAYIDKCASFYGATSEHKQHSCDDNSCQPLTCSECENTKKKKVPPMPKNHWHAKQKSSPNHFSSSRSSTTESSSTSSTIPSGLPHKHCSNGQVLPSSSGNCLNVQT